MAADALMIDDAGGELRLTLAGRWTLDAVMGAKALTLVERRWAGLRLAVDIEDHVADLDQGTGDVTVADLGLGDRLAHAGGRAGDGVAVQVDLGTDDGGGGGGSGNDAVSWNSCGGRALPPR